MTKTIFIIRCIFLLLCLGGAALLHYVGGDGDKDLPLAQQVAFWVYLVVGGLIGALTILVDVLLKGFSLRGLTALTLGLFMGSMVAYLISTSPLFEQGDKETVYLSRLSLFVICTYLGAVITLRGKDEFNLVIPYVRFVPQEVELPVVVIDASALIDGRVVGICRSGFMPAEVVITRFIIEELQRVASSDDPVRQEKGQKGLTVLNELAKIPHLKFKIHESEVEKRNQIEAKLIFIAKNLNARLLTLDYNLIKLAEFQGVSCLNVNALARELRSEVAVEERLTIDLAKVGREDGQAIGYLSDGSMVVVKDAAHLIGQTIRVEVTSVVPSGSGKIVFAEVVRDSPRS